MKPMLKVPGTEGLKLKYDLPLSNFAFKFNLRRCITELESEADFPYDMEEFRGVLVKAGAYTRPLFGST
jgi:hypothetical protein